MRCGRGEVDIIDYVPSKEVIAFEGAETPT